MNILSIKETCIYVKDLDRTKDFYVAKLGLQLISLVKGRHVFFRAGSSVLLCFIADETKKENVLPPHGAEGVVHFAFEVSKEDYTNALSQIQNSTSPFCTSIYGRMVPRSFYFHDPDKNLVEIIEQGLWEG